MPDYARLLDDEVKAFLAKSDAFYPPDAVSLSIAEQRRVYDKMCAAFDVGRPEGLVVEDVSLAGVPCRRYVPEGAVGTILYAHGGGFVVGGLDSHDSICAELAVGAGMELVAIDYRMSPEHPHPEDFEDVVAVFEARTWAGPLVLCGDSAGGNLVAALAHARRDFGFSGQVLIYPGLGGDRTQGSYVTHAEAPALSVQDLLFYEEVRAGGRDKTGDATWAPLADRDFAGLPPTVIFTAECDPLSSDGESYVARLTEAGGAGIWREEAGLVHGYLRARHMSSKARASFERMIRSLRALREGHLPDLVSNSF